MCTYQPSPKPYPSMQPAYRTIGRQKLPHRRHHTSPQLEITNVGKATALSPLYKSGRGGPSRIRCVKRCTPNTCCSTHKHTATQRTTSTRCNLQPSGQTRPQGAADPVETRCMRFLRIQVCQNISPQQHSGPRWLQHNRQHSVLCTARAAN